MASVQKNPLILSYPEGGKVVILVLLKGIISCFILSLTSVILIKSIIDLNYE